MSEKALDTQIGGNHYKDLKIQPIEYILQNNIGYIEGNVIKYITRHKAKNGIEDVKKAKHYCETLIEQYEKGENYVSTGILPAVKEVFDEGFLKMKEEESKYSFNPPIPQQVVDLEKEAEYFENLPVGSMFFVDDENGMPRKVEVVSVSSVGCSACDFKDTAYCVSRSKRPGCMRKDSIVYFKFVK